MVGVEFPEKCPKCKNDLNGKLDFVGDNYYSMYSTSELLETKFELNCWFCFACLASFKAVLL